MTHPMTSFMRWAATPPQRATFLAFRRTIAMAALDGEDIDVLDGVLSRQGENMVFGTVVEAFATLPLVEGASFATAYAQSAEGRSDTRGADYCRQLQKAPFRLYRIVSAVPGEGVELCPLEGKEDSLFAHDVRASEWMLAGDCLAARIVDWDGREELSGGMLPFSDEDATTTLREFAKFKQELTEEGGIGDGLDAVFASPEACFLNAWLAVQLDAAARQQKPKRRARGKR